MTEQEKRARVKVLTEELLQIRKVLREKVLREKGLLDEERESEIYIEINRLSLDPAWSSYIGGRKKDANGNYVDNGYYDKKEQFLMDKFLDKIFSKENIIELGYTPIEP